MWIKNWRNDVGMIKKINTVFSSEKPFCSGEMQLQMLHVPEQFPFQEGMAMLNLVSAVILAL